MKAPTTSNHEQRRTPYMLQSINQVLAQVKDNFNCPTNGSAVTTLIESPGIKLSAFEKQIAGKLIYLSKKYKYCIKKYQNIADELKCCYKTVQRAMDNFELLGWIEKKWGGSGPLWITVKEGLSSYFIKKSPNVQPGSPILNIINIYIDPVFNLCRREVPDSTIADITNAIRHLKAPEFEVREIGQTYRWLILNERIGEIKSFYYYTKTMILNFRKKLSKIKENQAIKNNFQAIENDFQAIQDEIRRSALKKIEATNNLNKYEDAAPPPDGFFAKLRNKAL